MVAGAARSATVGARRRPPRSTGGRRRGARAARPPPPPASRSSGHTRPPTSPWVSSTNTADGAAHPTRASATHRCHLRRVERAVGVVERHELRGGVAAGRGRLADDHVLPPAREHHRARPAEQRAARSGWPSCPTARTASRLLADPLGERRLEARDGGVVAEAVVAHLGLGHRPAHLGVGRVTVSLRRSTRPWGSGTHRNLVSAAMSDPADLDALRALAERVARAAGRAAARRARARPGPRWAPRPPAPTWSPRWTGPRRR